jgi:hypothetical protein
LISSLQTVQRSGCSACEELMAQKAANKINNVRIFSPFQIGYRQRRGVA